MFKNVLVSTSDKTGLIEFLGPLADRGCRIVSTGGTSQFLREHQIKVVEVAEQTGFPEVMDGRVRTLHPSIHMPILARQNVAEDFELLKKNNLEPFDLVIVNLYPFADALAKNIEGAELIEFIDIGGPSLLRAASKNFERIAVVCDPKDYHWIAQKIEQKKELNLEDRKKLAAKVFYHTSQYDALIARVLDPKNYEKFILSGDLNQELRYGENPNQQAWWYREHGAGLHDAEILHGKALSYNNLLDIEAASRVAREFTDSYAAVAVKHNSPCGLASHSSASEAVRLALGADPVSVFGGIIACNFEVDEVAADFLSKIFLEAIVADGFSKAALEKLTKKKDLRLLKWNPKNLTRQAFDVRSVSGGFLVQTTDLVGSWNKEWTIIGDQPTAEVRADLLLAWRAAAHLKSNAIAIAAQNQSLGMGMGQVNRVDAVEHAIQRARKNHPELLKKAVLASDAFFPFADSIDLIHEAGIRWIIQPGGSVRDEEVFAKAKEHKINLVITGTRHFRH
jgi:phosphoribosylaminoimidazolecarboxamide formyltransferase/IMP cyclohydrolase